MCAVSQISDYGRKNIWPQLPQVLLDQIGAPDWRDVEIARLRAELDKYAAFKETLDAAKALDIAADQADCPDPDKVKWLESLDQRMKQIEAVLGLR